MHVGNQSKIYTMNRNSWKWRRMAPSLLFLVFYFILFIKTIQNGFRKQIPMVLVISVILGSIYVFYVFYKKIKEVIKS